MGLIGAAELVALLAALTAFVLVLAGPKGTWIRDVRLPLLLLVVLAILRSLSNALQWSGVSLGFGPVEDYLELAEPPAWYFLFYAFVQSATHRQLRRSEEQQRILLASLPQRIFFKDSDSVFVFANEPFARELGLRPEDVIGKTDFDLHPEELARKYREDDKRIMGSGQPETLVEGNVVGGVERTVEVVKAPVIDDEGQMVGLFGIFTDITERIEAERALRESEQKFRSLADQSPNMIFINKGGRVVYANRKCEDLMGYSQEEFVDPDFDFLALIAPQSVGTIKENYAKHLRGEDVPPYEYALRTQDGGELPAIITSKLITYEGEPAILGVVTDITERIEAEEALRASEERFRGVLSSLHRSLITVLDRDGRHTEVWGDPELRERYGIEPRDMVGRSLSDLLPPELAEERIADIQRVFETGEPVRAEFPVRFPAGDFWHSISISPMRDASGQVCGIVAFIRDVTERKQAEEALGEAEERHRLILENATDLIALHSLDDFLFVYVNPATVRTLGYAEDELIGRDPADLIHPDDMDRAMEAFANGLSRGEAAEVRYRKKDGTYIWLEQTGRVLPSEADTRMALTISRDVTARKEAEEARREAEDRYRQISENATDLITLHSLHDVSYLYVNPATLRKLGYTQEELLGRSALDFVHPEDGERAVLALREGVERGQGSGEFRYMKKDGSYLWLEATGKVVTGERGEPVALLISRDITDRKEAEEALQESEERFRSLFEAATEFIQILDAEGRIVAVNPAARDKLGYADEELFGQRLTDFFTPESRVVFEQHFPTLLDRGSYRQEAEIACQDGSVITVDCSAAAIRDDEGNVTSIVALLRDVTDRVRVREELRMLSVADVLTGLSNRRGFFHLAEQQLKFANRSKSAMLLLFADLDGLKDINDAHGHKEGDLALVETANVLGETFRESDILGRVGGDEFAVLAVAAPDTTAQRINERIQERIGARNAQPDRAYQLSISVGIASYDPDNPCSLEELMARADALMYGEKRRKREQQGPA